MSDCIFCKIVAGEMPNYTVYEDEFALAFLDIFPHAVGHTVVIPKVHRDNFMELTAEESQKLIVSVKNTMERIKTVLNPDGFNVGWNENALSGQTIPHLHFLIFPRYKGDGGTSVHSIIKKSSSISVTDTAEKFKK